jgi:hypothetical protein
VNLIWRAIILNGPPIASHFLVVDWWYTVCSWSPFARWLLQCLLESFWGPCDSSAVAIQVSVWYIDMPTAIGTRSVLVNSNWNVQLMEFYIGKKIYRHTKKFFNDRFHFRQGKNLQKTCTDWRKVDRICGKWGYSWENFGTTCTGVGA